MKHLKIATKSLWKHNRGNQIFALCIVLLALLPVLLYNTVFSVMHQVEQSHKAVFGSFTDIYYEDTREEADHFPLSRADLMQLLPGFYVQSFGTFSTVYSEMIDETKKLNIGTADENALILADVSLIEGRLPEADGEIALTQGMAQLLGDKKLGNSVIINKADYHLCGIVQDFGHLWPKGEEQIQKKITPVNAFVTENEALRILKNEGFVQRQLLIERVSSVISESDDNPRLFANVNNSPESNIKFVVPKEFLALIYVAALVMVSMVLLLNRRRLRTRIGIYMRLGLPAKDISAVLCLEQLFLLLAGLAVGLVIGCGLTRLLLLLLTNLLGQSIPLAFDWPSILQLLGALLAGPLLLVLGFNLSAVYAKKDCDRKRYKQKQLRLWRFECKQHGKSLAALTLLMLFSFSLIAYGGFYGAFFKSDLFESAPGTLVQDYDFQFVTHPQSAAPADGFPVIFTDTFEKLGATSEFVQKLSNDSAIKSVKAYRENNKFQVLLKQSQLDDYLDAYDFALDGQYDCSNDTGINDFNVIAHQFGYAQDDLLAGTEVLSYPPEVLKALERSVVEGKIDLQKLASGEEIILRAPSFLLESIQSSQGLNGTVRRPVDSDKQDVLQSTAIRVGDTITLTGLLTDEILNGGILEEQLEAYQRYDTQVKIGAIIRNTDGLFPVRGSFGRPYSLLTVSEGMDALGIPATYSTVSVYTNNARFSEQELAARMNAYTAEAPTMVLENWQADIKTYRVFNTMVAIFVTVLLTILTLTTFVILTSQLLAKTQMSMKNYALLRMNGLPFNRLLRMWLMQLSGILMIGCLPGVPIALMLMQCFGLRGDFHILEGILYYFPAAQFVYIFVGMILIAALAAAPSLLYLYKHKDSVMFDSD
jgi:ABC-type antimicrobial peptide transport system permease subunit